LIGVKVIITLGNIKRKKYWSEMREIYMVFVFAFHSFSSITPPLPRTSTLLQPLPLKGAPP
jgi:hypothetical protein